MYLVGLCIRWMVKRLICSFQCRYIGRITSWPRIYESNSESLFKFLQSFQTEKEINKFFQQFEMCSSYSFVRSTLLILILILIHDAFFVLIFFFINFSLSRLIIAVPNLGPVMNASLGFIEIDKKISSKNVRNSRIKAEHQGQNICMVWYVFNIWWVWFLFWCRSTVRIQTYSNI